MGAALLLLEQSVSAQSITEYPLPHSGSGPNWIAAGPDGSLWFTESDGNRIGTVTIDGAFTEFTVPTSGSNPWGITSGPDGNLWFTEMFSSKIGRIAPATGAITEFTIPTADSSPSGITAGPDGNLWFVEVGGNNVGRITPSGVITEFPIPFDDSLPEGIASGPDGNLWFAESLGDRIGRITTSGKITQFGLSESSYPLIITSGPDGNLWFTENLHNKIGRMTTSGSLTEFAVSGYPWGICQGPDGNLWFLESGGNRVGKITTSGAVTTYTVPTAGSDPIGVVAGPDGAIWFTEHDGNKIGKIVPPVGPTVNGIDPSSGPGSGGASISVAGSGFQPGATVSVGAPASNVVVVSDTQITANVPYRVAGTLTDVVVTNPDASSATLAQGWLADFLDVDQSDGFHEYVAKIFRNGITAGCGSGNYCRNTAVTRAQMAVFLLKAEHGSTYSPPACTGVFDDVTCPSLYADWIEQLSDEGITGGCGGGNYCPGSPVTRQQMAAFLLKTEHGSGYLPPTCLSVFDDVECPSLFADWIEQLYAEGITGGCSTDPLLYCPGNLNTRGQMAVFLAKTFHLP